MFRVTVDIFSGRPNPSWIVTGEEESRALVGAVAQAPEVMGRPGEGVSRLGYRGVLIELLGDDEENGEKLPAAFTLADRPGEGLQRGAEIALGLIEDLLRHGQISLPEHALTPLDAPLREFLLQELRDFVERPPRLFPAPIRAGRGRRRTVHDERCRDCRYEISRFNPGFWNSDPGVRRNNNCYNYARNWRTNTFAQPGRASGCFPYGMTCGEVVRAAECDGLRPRCRCLPDQEYPRRHLALVVWPGRDYHWYREQIGGFWGHKPGSTAARNTDNSGATVVNPETCDRGGYTEFCGYFYAGRSVRIV